ncbi:HIT domain-containing protein [Virgibacillus halophilus]|uniref:HIT domain-containing protein n=1 Tax=Tigheibacillus halophilus TaxID=361280 RepID=A0ABU5C4H5_9BACI|nr:HIT domain-containing protein [Virgibacillus halophilus]
MWFPKKHYREFKEVDQETLSEIILTAQQIAIAVEKLLKTDGITIMQENGAFKDVEHYHMHIVPRFINDGFTWVEPKTKIPKEAFKSLSDNLEKTLAETFKYLGS